MKKETKFYRLFSLVCCMGTLIAAGLLAYMLHLSAKYPEAESFSRSVRAAGILTLAWIGALSYFTVRYWKEKKK
jgi:hypothetical protein